MVENLSISICVPAFNEEKSLHETVEELIKSLSSHVHQLEIIVVNDGSSDRTPEVAQRLVKDCPQVKVLHHKNNLGIGSSYRDALAIARGDYFTWFPADLENSAEQFIKSLPYLAKDTIITYHHIGFDRRTALRRMISRVYTWILNKYFKLNLKYYNGLTVFPASVLRSVPLAANRYIFFAETVIRAIQSGCKVVEFSVPLRKRKNGKSKVFSFSSLVGIIQDLWRIVRAQKQISLGKKQSYKYPGVA
jgi:glycosyltransferase involved in cell wall biosynthesis